MKALVGFSAAAVALMVSACLPKHLGSLDAASASTVVQKTPGGSFSLINPNGIRFEPQGELTVKFEVNRVLSSRVIVSDSVSEAIFVLPKSLLNSESNVASIPATESGQPVDLKIKDVVSIVPAAVKYRRASSKEGWSEYFRDTYKVTEHKIYVRIYSAGALERGSPTYLHQADLEMAVQTDGEFVKSEKISAEQFKAATGELTFF